MAENRPRTKRLTPKSADGKAGSKKLPTALMTPQGTAATYVDVFVAQSREDVLYLSVFQHDPPVILGEKDREQLEHLVAYCQGRYVMTRTKAKELVEVLQKQLKKPAGS